MFIGKQKFKNKFISIKILDSEIKHSSVIKFLGHYLDETLSWTNHIKHL